MVLLYLVSMARFFNAYLPIEKIRSFLFNETYSVSIPSTASFFGAVTPVLLSSVPLFIGFVKGGIPLGVTFLSNYISLSK